MSKIEQALWALGACLLAWLYVVGLVKVAKATVAGDYTPLFEPQWKREADFLARSIPNGDHWRVGSDDDCAA